LEVNYIMERQQLEKFSDRAIGIAIVLLILVFSLPIGKIAQQHNWGQSVSHLVIFGFSFLTICVFWVALSRVIGFIAKPVLTKKIVCLGVLYFLFLVLLPFSSVWLAGNPYLPASIRLYSLNLLLGSILYLLLLNAALRLNCHIYQHLTEKARLWQKKLALAGPVLYIASFVVSYFNIYISFIAIAGALCLYAFLFNRSMPDTIPENS